MTPKEKGRLGLKAVPICLAIRGPSSATAVTNATEVTEDNERYDTILARSQSRRPG
jgi:hypothetical protein